MRQKYKRITHIIIGLTLIASVLFLLHLNREYKIKQARDLHQISRFSPNILKANELADARFDFTTLRSLNSVEFLSLDHQELPTVGSLSIPTLKMELPIYNGISDENMYFGAGTMRPIQKMGVSNYVIGSHIVPTNNELLFGPLMKIRMKDKIYLTDLEKTYIYEVDEIKTVNAIKNTDLFDATDEAIVTLITFNQKGNAHVIVQGTLQQKVTILDIERPYLN